MKIAISATGTVLDAEVDPRFGRCQYFIIADPETMQFELLENSSATASGGAGVSAAQAVASKGVQAVLTGNCGPNAHQVFSAAGIQVITGVSGNVKNAIEGYKSGKLQAGPRPGAASQSGTGRGMGRGGRRIGIGQGMGMGAGTIPAVGPEPELQVLKAQSQSLSQQLGDIKRRIEQLEKRQ